MNKETKNIYASFLRCLPASMSTAFLPIVYQRKNKIHLLVHALVKTPMQFIDYCFLRLSLIHILMSKIHMETVFGHDSAVTQFLSYLSLLSNCMQHLLFNVLQAVNKYLDYQECMKSILDNKGTVLCLCVTKITS